MHERPHPEVAVRFWVSEQVRPLASDVALGSTRPLLTAPREQTLAGRRSAVPG